MAQVLLITRAAARPFGLVRYFTGRACLNGHVMERYVRDSKCVGCNRMNVAARQATNPIPHQIYDARWRNKNKESASVRMSVWRKANPTKVAAQKSRHRALQHSAEGSYTEEDIAEINSNQQGQCAACWMALSKSGAHIDHVVPLARGGSNWPSNIQLLCPTCNFSKGAKLMVEWVSGASTYPPAFIVQS